MKKILKMLALAAVVCVAGCNDDIEDLEREIDSLKSRVTALESQVDVLNENITALTALSQKGATITSVEEKDGAYTITLSNGEVITLTQGSEAEAVIPVMGIDAEGYWVVDYRDGAGFVRILVEGQPVKATATNGVTPLFRIDADSYWEVSYNQGESYERVLDTNNQPVSAIGTGTVTDKFFADVKVEGDNLYVELLTGQKLYIPILPDFYCRIIAPEGVQTFTPLQSVAYDVEIKGVEQVFLTAPDGWKVQLSEAIQEKAVLTVTAPEGVRSLADNTKDVAILALAGPYAVISKIQVELEGGVVVTPPTVESVVAVEEAATDTSLSFTVAVSEDADSWRWLCQEASLEAPNASTIAVTGTLGESETVVVNGLNPLTEYALYVVAVKAPSVYSEVVFAKAATTKPIDKNDYYEAGVTINGVTYNKDSEGVKLVSLAADATANFENSLSGVAFLEDDSETYDWVTTSSQALTKDLVMIGRYAGRRPLFKPVRYMALRNPGGNIIFKNVTLDFSAVTDGYIFNQGTEAQGVGGAKNLIFEDCDLIFSKILITFASADPAAGIENIIFRNCRIRFEDETTDNYTMITTKKVTDAGLTKFKSIVFDNNIIYLANETLKARSLFCQENATSATNTLENCAIVFKNNTVVDFIPYGSGLSGAYFTVKKFSSLEVSNNIFYSSQAAKYPTFIRVYNDYGETWPTWSVAKDGSIAWGTLGWKTFYTNNSDPTQGYAPAEGAGTFVKATEAPVTIDKKTGKVTKAEAYKTYGSTLE